MLSALPHTSCGHCSVQLHNHEDPTDMTINFGSRTLGPILCHLNKEPFEVFSAT